MIPQTSCFTASIKPMPSNQDTLFRHWHMLRRIPRYPSKITVQDLKNALENEDFVVTARTIQRDLQDLSQIFPLVVDDREKPYGWSWQQDARSFDLPGLTVPEALALVMAETHLQNMLPVSVLDHLRPHFRSAHHRLDGEPLPQRGRSWLDKVRNVPPTQPLLPPVINPDIQRDISHALLYEKQAEIAYRKKGETETVTYRIHPLGIVQRGPVLYLYCRLFNYDNTRILALHRIESVTVLAEDAVYPEEFDMDADCAKGIWGFGSGEMIQIKLKFTLSAGEHLYETPLSEDQTIEETADGGLLVTATVADTPQLQWWIRGFGDQVSVIGDAS